MYSRFRGWEFPLLLLFVLALPISVHASSSGTNATWIPGFETGYRLSLSVPICPTGTGNQNLNATVYGTLFGGLASDVNVFATIRKPDTSTTDINFTNNLNGTYTGIFNFDQNGTYFVQAHAFKPGTTQGDANAYLYVGPLSWTSAFLNNGFSLDIGASGTIRNTLTNSDGNRVYDINANTTIYYPDGTVADANGSMSQIPNGEFVRTFFGPSPSGVYTVATLYSCGTHFVWDNNGTFTVNATSGGTGGGTSGGTGSGSSGGGGGTAGGGGGGGGSKRAELLWVHFEPALSRNAPSAMTIRVQNLSNTVTDYRVDYTITNPHAEITEGSKIVLAVPPLGASTVTADAGFIPLLTGDYTVHAVLHPLSSPILTYDEYEAIYPVVGTHLTTLNIPATQNTTALGLTFPFTINLENTGDFDEDNVIVTWFIKDEQGTEYIRSSYSTSVPQNETKTLSYVPFIPIDEKVGLHQLTVEITAYGVVQTQTISFNVTSPSEYYAQLVSDIELRISQLDQKIHSLEGRGFDVRDPVLTLANIRTDFAMAKGMLLAGKYEKLSTQLIDLSERLTRLAALVDSLEQQSPLLSREGLTLILYIGAALLLALFVIFLWWVRTREKEDNPGNKGGASGPPAPVWGPRILSDGLSVGKGYYSKDERTKLKRKPLISRILGLLEEE